MDCYEQVADRLLHSRYAMALTGAGISVESGIPDFRSKNGLWSRYDPMEYAHIDSMLSHPGRVWEMLQEMDALLAGANPNAAHYALAEMEKRGILKAVVTQNIDSLHQRAGSSHVIEFHGHNRTLSCIRCGKGHEREAVSLDALPPRCSCGGALRPDIVFFGENIPSDAFQQAILAAESCDLMLIVGTSATVAPASWLPRAAKGNGAFLVEVNPTATQLSNHMTDIHIAQPAGKALPAILTALENRAASSNN